MALGRARVQQRVPLAYIMRTYRLAQETLWDWLFDHITAATADATEQAAALHPVSAYTQARWVSQPAVAAAGVSATIVSSVLPAVRLLSTILVANAVLAAAAVRVEQERR